MRELGSVCILALGVQTIVSIDNLTPLMSENFHDPWVSNPKRRVDTKNNDNLDAGQPTSHGMTCCELISSGIFIFLPLALLKVLSISNVLFNRVWSSSVRMHIVSVWGER